MFRVYNKDNDKIIFEGSNEKPNWVVRFKVQKSNLQRNQIIILKISNSEVTEKISESVIGRDNLGLIVSST